MALGFGTRRRPKFCSRDMRGRPSDLASCRSTAGSGRQQRGPDEAQEGARGAPCRADSAARSSAAGPRPQARGSGRAEMGCGPFSVSGRMNSSRIRLFFYFKAF